ncbi:cation transport protein-domain-containing protein [Dichotomocladium elegans]|nr:cation transport protein-domain-containing protein [Dichotomocladium elegans]
MSFLQPPTHHKSVNDHSDNSHSILFADNIEYQRQQARKELRACEGLLDKIASVHDAQDSFLETDAKQEAAEMEEIIRRPVYPYELTRKQRYCIGGVEYRALDFLSKMVPFYYIFINTLFTFAMRIYIACSSYAQDILKTSNPTPVNPWYFSFIVCFSAFNNLGYSPLDASMVPFQNAPAPLLFTAILIMLGNTGYAIALRAIIWVVYKLLPRSRQMDRDTMRFLLENPRRCYTSLFRSVQTWWLLFVLVALTVAETVVFVTTNFWLPVLQGIPWASRVLDGFFQGVAVRNGKYGVYPVGISIRNSNIYQERELGIYGDHNDDDEQGRASSSRLYQEKLHRVPSLNSVMSSSRKLLNTRPSFYVMTHLQRQLTHELFWLFAGIFCICVIESDKIMSRSPVTALTVIYECVSAFGTSGSSTGYPNASTSQSAQYHTLGKLVIIALMYRGRHRGLPSAIDHAVLLPSEKLNEKEKQEQEWRKKHIEINQLYEPEMKHRAPRWRAHTSHTMI